MGKQRRRILTGLFEFSLKPFDSLQDIRHGREESPHRWFSPLLAVLLAVCFAGGLIAAPLSALAEEEPANYWDLSTPTGQDEPPPSAEQPARQVTAPQAPAPAAPPVKQPADQPVPPPESPSPPNTGTASETGSDEQPAAPSASQSREQGTAGTESAGATGAAPDSFQIPRVVEETTEGEPKAGAGGEAPQNDTEEAAKDVTEDDTGSAIKEAPPFSPSAGEEEELEEPFPSREELAGRGVDTLYRLGLQARKEGSLRRADSYFRTILRRAPYHFPTRLTLGRIALRRHPRQALEHFRIAKQVFPSSEEVNYLLGQALERVGRSLEAAEAYRQTIYINPRHYKANKRLRKILQRLRSEKSVVQKAAEVFYTNPSLATLTLFGKVVMSNAEPRQAILEFEEVKRRQPELPEAELWMARAFRALHDEDGEIRAYSAYLNDNPKAAGVRLLLVERLAGQGWFQKAAVYLKPFTEPDAKGITPFQSARITFLRSRLLSARRDPGGAAELLLQAQRQKYDAREIERAFAEDLALYPEAATVWFSYALWLEDNRQPGESAEFFRQAALIDPAYGQKSRQALERLLSRGKALESARLALAQLSFAEGEESGALAHLETIPAGHPLDPEASLLRGRIHRKNKDLDAALDAFTRYVFSFRDRNGIIYARGNLFWETGRKEEAVAAWMENPDVLIRQPWVMLKVAQYHQERGNVRDEIQIRTRLLDVLPANQDNPLRLGDLYDGEGRRRDALNLWSRLIDLRPRDPELLLRTARGWIALGEKERGLGLLKRAAQLQPLPAADASLLAGALYETNQYSEALEFYWELYKTQPDHPDLPRVLPVLALNVPTEKAVLQVAARLAHDHGRLEQAVEVMEILINQSPQDTEARMALAEIYLRLDKPRAAGQVLTGQDAIPDDDESGLSLLATVQGRTGDHKGLAGTLVKLRRLRPDDGSLARELGLLRIRLGHSPQARPLLEEALAGNPQDSDVLLALAQIEAARGNKKAAVAYLNTLLEVDPGHGAAKRQRMTLLVRMARWKEAIPVLEDWLTGHSGDSTARYNLITAYLYSYRNEEARPHYEKLRKTNPGRARQLKRYFP